MEGWISLHRQLQDNSLWTCEPFTRGQAWVDLLLIAAHSESFFYVRGIKVNVERGQLAWGEVKLSERWRWSRSKLRKYLNDLEKEQQIEQHKSSVIQVITIVNYDKYQQKVQQSEQQKDNRRTTEGQQKDIYNNVNNENNVNTVNKRVVFAKPNTLEIIDYCKERENNVDAAKFFDFYESKGWMVGKNKMKDWKAALRTWENTEQKKPVKNLYDGYLDESDFKND